MKRAANWVIGVTQVTGIGIWLEWREQQTELVVWLRSLASDLSAGRQTGVTQVTVIGGNKTNHIIVTQVTFIGIWLGGRERAANWLICQIAKSSQLER